jgi:glycosyltransferase involved in cell wall biosynthesis
MRVMQVLDVGGTGAAIAAERLAKALAAGGHEVMVAMKFRPAASPIDVQTHGRSLSLRGLAHISPDPLANWEERIAAGRWLDKLARDFKPDVINIHSLAAARSFGFSFRTTSTCNAHAPVVWTLHDMWTFTARCLNSDGCSQFLTGCTESCPTASEHPALPARRISGEWELRRQVISACASLAAVAPSRWMTEQARSGLWCSRRVDTIPNSIPLNLYRPISRDAAREILGLPKGAVVLICGAAYLDDPRKGPRYLIEALPMLDCRGALLLSMGNGKLPTGELPLPHQSLGYLDDDRLKACAYSAADIYVHCATADNLPNMVLESIACGTPVVAFAVGGVPEAVREGQTGWLAAETTSEALAAVLSRAIAEVRSGLDLRASCRRVAETEYSPELQASRYIKLFHELN